MPNKYALPQRVMFVPNRLQFHGEFCQTINNTWLATFLAKILNACQILQSVGFTWVGDANYQCLIGTQALHAAAAHTIGEQLDCILFIASYLLFPD